MTRWRCIVLSSGERTIATAMAEGAYRAKAGQSVRLLDIPTARRFGAWDELHGLPTGTAFSDAIKRAATTHHGHAGRAFLHRLTGDQRDFCELLERFKALPALSVDGGEGQDRRAAGRFALLALAGELATEYGITGWPESEALHAAAVGFAAWRSLRGRVNRAGWWRDEPAGRVFLFNADGLREALTGFDFKRALDTLQEVGALPASSGERAKPQRIGGRVAKLYEIRADKLRGDDEH